MIKYNESDMKEMGENSFNNGYIEAWSDIGKGLCLIVVLILIVIMIF
ncbi:hypothetical protein M0R04_15450 [Candidatus Dojkabacteria bacterium]|nr:hypothetical protein [Candidatus Dojkabacteria bacterium]